MGTAPPKPPPDVLYVDDDESNRLDMTLILQNAGFNVWEASTGEEALVLAARQPDLILLDVNLPGLNGIEVCRRIKADPATHPIPVLHLSGERVTSEDKVRGLEEGADCYLTKPIDPAELVAQVKAFLRVKHAEEQAQAARAEAEEVRRLLAAIVESSEDAILSYTLDGIITSWNPGAERLYGYSAAEVKGKSMALLIPPDLPYDLSSILGKVRQGKATLSYETVRLRKDGQRVDVSQGISPIRDAAGRVIAASIIARDITQQKRLEDQYRQAQKMEAIGRLAGGIAHDFNNLLTVITGFAEIVLGRLGPEDPVRGMIAEIKKAGDRAASLTRQLLAYSRKQMLTPVVLDLNTLVVEMEKMLRRMLGEDVDLITVLQPDLGPIKADPGQIEQVLMNLAINARDAMPKGGKLTIQTKNVELDESYTQAHPYALPGPYALLAVSDNGSGMDVQTRTHAFEPFFTTKEVGKGTGLGLATVYGIIKQSGGSIEVYSEPGLGTTFKIYLPRLQKNETRAAKPDPSLRDAPRGDETVLLVEDEDAVRGMTRHLLQSSGYQVLVAGQGAEALRLSAQHGGPIHLLLTDVVMPNMSGRQVAERLLLLHPEMKVLYLSGYTDDAVVRHGVLEAEANFMQKPFSPVALARKIREILDSSQ